MSDSSRFWFGRFFFFLNIFLFIEKIYDNAIFIPTKKSKIFFLRSITKHGYYGNVRVLISRLFTKISFHFDLCRETENSSR